MSEKILGDQIYISHSFDVKSFHSLKLIIIFYAYHSKFVLLPHVYWFYSNIEDTKLMTLQIESAKIAQ